MIPSPIDILCSQSRVPAELPAIVLERSNNVRAQWTFGHLAADAYRQLHQRLCACIKQRAGAGRQADLFIELGSDMLRRLAIRFAASAGAADQLARRVQGELMQKCTMSSPGGEEEETTEQPLVSIRLVRVRVRESSGPEGGGLACPFVHA